MAIKGLDRKLRIGLKAIEKTRKYYPDLYGGLMDYGVIVALCTHLNCKFDEMEYYLDNMKEGKSWSTWFYIPKESYEELVRYIDNA